MTEADIDMRRQYWGHALYGIKEHDDKSWSVSGCMTPLPQKNKTVILGDGSIWRFRSVTPWRKPRDGFNAVIEPATPPTPGG
jgi:hypothetical protein